MEFLSLILFVLFLGFVGINIWEEWQERVLGNPLEIRFLPRHIFRYLNTQEVRPSLREGTFYVHTSGGALRCEICHQKDFFEESTGTCSRCNHITI